MDRWKGPQGYGQCNINGKGLVQNPSSGFGSREHSKRSKFVSEPEQNCRTS